MFMFFQTLLVTLAVFFGMALNYLFNFFMARSLSPALYGELAIVIALYNDLFVPGGSLQMLATREIARLDKKGKEKKINYLVKKLGLIALSIGLVFSILLLLSSLFIDRFLNDSQLKVPLQVMAFGVPFAFVLSITKAYLQGKEKITEFSLLTAAEPTIKLVFGVSLVFLGFGLVGASTSLVLPSIFLLAIYSRIFFKQGERHEIKISKSFIVLTITSMLMMLYFYLDLYFVRLYLGAEQTGYYNVASITSKVLVYASGGLTAVVLPKYSKENSKRLKPIIVNSLIFTLPILVIFLLMPDFIIKFFYSEKYLLVTDTFVILCFAMFVHSLFRVFATLLWSRKKDDAVLVLTIIGLLAEFIMLIAFAKYGIKPVAYSVLASSVLMTVSCFAFLKK
jgi:O-antigen/teichoic acid export membrane protein